MTPHFVYGLVDATQAVRYIGVTAALDARIRQHSRNGRIVAALGGAVRHIVIAAVAGVRAGRVVERYFIQRLSATRDLLNVMCVRGAATELPQQLPSTPATPIRTEAARIVRERFDAGEPVDAIAASYGVSRRAVYRWATERMRPSRTVAGRIVADRGLSKRPDSSAPGGGA